MPTNRLSSLDAIQTRLGLIEGVLSTVLATVEKPAQQPSDVCSANSLDEYADSIPDPDDFDRDRFASPRPTLSARPQIPPTCDWQDLNKLHGSSLLISFGFEAYFVLSERLVHNFYPNNPAQAESKERFLKYQDNLYQNLLRSLSSFDNLDLVQHNQVVVLPPRAFIDDVFDSFFRELNPIMPMFRPDSFRDLIIRTYATPAEVGDMASVVCINNVILHTLSAKAKFTRSGPTVAPLDVGMSDLHTLLLKNAKRALAITKRFMTPRLINVQALLSLCLVAQENFQIGLAEAMLEQACQVARMMGLNRKHRVPPEPSPSDVEEKSSVFWSLFIMDKHISSLMGNSCRLPSYDCDLPFPEDEHFQRYLVPQIRLARIQEQIYIDLYSAHAKGRSSTSRQRRIPRLRKSLEQWYKLHEGVLTAEDPVREQELESEHSTKGHFRLALNFCFHNTRIMACRDSEDEETAKLCLEDARKGIKLMLSVCTLSGTIGGCHLFRGYVQFLTCAILQWNKRINYHYPSCCLRNRDLISCILTLAAGFKPNLILSSVLLTLLLQTPTLSTIC